MALVTVTSGATVKAEDLNQVIEALDGTTGEGQLIKITDINSDTDYAVDIRNKHATLSKGLRVRDSNNNVLLTVDKNGVTFAGDQDITGKLTVTGEKPSDNTATPGFPAETVLVVTGGEGGDSTLITTAVGGIGGGLELIGGLGGEATAADTAATGGAGGDIDVTSGAGGDASGALTVTGGKGGTVTIEGGVGGDVATGSTLLAGEGGDVDILGGNAGAGGGDIDGGTVIIDSGVPLSAGVGSVLIGPTNATVITLAHTDATVVFAGTITQPVGKSLDINGTKPDDVATQPGTTATQLLDIVAPDGGDTTITDTGRGGTGSSISLQAGDGGLADDAVTYSRGGYGGTVNVYGGDGGVANGAGETVGGDGGGISIIAGDGGAASAGTPRTGGPGGDLQLYSGDAGVGSGTNANAGTVSLDSGAPDGSGTGIILIGTGNATNITMGNAGCAVTISGTIAGITMVGNIGLTGDITQTGNVDITGNLDLGGDLNVTFPADKSGQVLGTKPADTGGASGSSAVSLINMVGAAGGDTTNATTGTGGTGGTLFLIGGQGGVAASANTTSTGGQGGGITVNGGVGGAAAATGTDVGGEGGTVTIAGGAGGAATVGATKTGGDGGAVLILAGNAGAGVEAANGGAVNIQSGEPIGAGTSIINIGTDYATIITIGNTSSVIDVVGELNVTMSAAAIMDIDGTKPANVSDATGDNAVRLLDILGAAGGDTTNTGSAAGGLGGNIMIEGGIGGVAADADTESTGGGGGQVGIRGGMGGNAAAAGIDVGGAGGAIVLAGGAGGDATAGATKTGGEGGTAYLLGGDAGISTENAVGGTVSIQSGEPRSAGASVINIGTDHSTTITIGKTTTSVKIAGYFGCNNATPQPPALYVADPTGTPALESAVAAILDLLIANGQMAAS